MFQILIGTTDIDALSDLINVFEEDGAKVVCA